MMRIEGLWIPAYWIAQCVCGGARAALRHVVQNQRTIVRAQWLHAYAYGNASAHVVHQVCLQRRLVFATRDVVSRAVGPLLDRDSAGARDLHGPRCRAHTAGVLSCQVPQNAGAGVWIGAMLVWAHAQVSRAAAGRRCCRRPVPPPQNGCVFLLCAITSKARTATIIGYLLVVVVWQCAFSLI